MRKITFLAIFIISIVNLFAQEGKVLEEINFEKSVFQYNKELDHYYCIPWNYNTTENKSRQFPLIIYLHGGGGAGKISTFDYLGYSENNSPEDKIAKNFQIKYPSFILLPQSRIRGWDTGKLIALIEDFKSNYRIDNKRIYLIGYSGGGSGSYIFANEYYDYNQTLFAAIIRLAGQSQTILREAIALNTSVWLHIGLIDTPKRIDVTREAYNFLKSKHPDATESVKKIDINGITGITLTLIKNNSEIIKKTEYNEVGHGIYRFPFDDNSLISWLFNQKLD